MWRSSCPASRRRRIADAVTISPSNDRRRNAVYEGDSTLNLACSSTSRRSSRPTRPALSGHPTGRLRRPPRRGRPGAAVLQGAAAWSQAIGSGCSPPTASPYVEALFAIAALGAVAVPMNYRAKQREVAHLLADSGAKVVLVEARYPSLVEESRPPRPSSTSCTLDDEWPERPDAAEELFEIAEVDDGDLAILLYTSGTTSLPKGVMLTHGALTDYVMGRNEPADGEDHGRMLLAAPLYHIAGVTSLLGALYSGRHGRDVPQFDATDWLAPGRRRAGHPRLPRADDGGPAHRPPGVRRGRTSSPSRSVTYGAAPMPPADHPPGPRAVPAVGRLQPGVRPDRDQLDGHRAHARRPPPRRHATRRSPTRCAGCGSVGRAVDDVEVRVVDPRRARARARRGRARSSCARVAR